MGQRSYASQRLLEVFPVVTIYRMDLPTMMYQGTIENKNILVILV